jgi:hypothetical protein
VAKLWHAGTAAPRFRHDLLTKVNICAIGSCRFRRVEILSQQNDEVNLLFHFYHLSKRVGCSRIGCDFA